MKHISLLKVLLVALLAMTMCLTVYADSYSSQTAGGAVPFTEEQHSVWLMNHDRSMKEIYTPADVATYATWRQVSGHTYYAQEWYTTCGIACIRMALKSINGSCGTESDIFDEVRDLGLFTYEFGSGKGMTSEQVMEYLNLKQNGNYYINEHGQTSSNMKSDIYSVIVGKDAPAIVGVIESAHDMWPFENEANLGPHWIVVYGITDYMDQFKIADPYAGFKGATLYNQYTLTLEALYAGYNEEDIGYLW